MQEFVEGLSKVGRYVLYLAVALAVVQLVLRGLGVDIEIPIITQLIELTTNVIVIILRAFNNLLRSGHPL